MPMRGEALRRASPARSRPGRADGVAAPRRVRVIVREERAPNP